MRPLYIYIGAGALALSWLLSRGNAAALGSAAGGAAVDLVVGVVGGAGGAVAAVANNPSVNPLQPVGSWIGVTIYDLFH